MKREISPTVAVVVIVVVIALVLGAYWFLSGGTGVPTSDQPARPLQPPPNFSMPGGVGVGAPSTPR